VAEQALPSPSMQPSLNQNYVAGQAAAGAVAQGEGSSTDEEMSMQQGSAAQPALNLHSS
jgi:hypothetical protein